MKSHIETVSDEASLLRSQYTADFQKSLDREKQLADLKKETAHAHQESLAMIVSTSGIKGALQRHRAEKRYSKLSRLHGSTIAERYEAEMKLLSTEGLVRQHWHENSDEYLHAALLDAHKDGVTIETKYPNELDKAQWQSKNITSREDKYELIRAFNLDTLTQAELENNLQSYPEMKLHFTNAELAQAREYVDTIPLFHTTSSPKLMHMEAPYPHDILTHSQLEEHDMLRNMEGGQTIPESAVRGFTFDDDISMGLDKYTFMCLGLPYPVPHADEDAAVVIAINPKLLDDEACIVSPVDLANICSDGGDGIECQRDLDARRNYRESTVSGRGWKEIIARRLALHRHEQTQEPFDIKDCFTFGEVKYRDGVPAGAIQTVLTSNDEIRKYFDEKSSSRVFKLSSDYMDDFAI